MPNIKKMKRSEFENLYQERIKESALQDIREDESYQQGYKGPIEEYEDEIFESNYDEFVDNYAEMLGVELK